MWFAKNFIWDCVVVGIVSEKCVKGSRDKE